MASYVELDELRTWCDERGTVTRSSCFILRWRRPLESLRTQP